MTEDQVWGPPVVVDLPTAARVLGLGRNTAYELVRSGAWPTPVLPSDDSSKCGAAASSNCSA